MNINQKITMGAVALCLSVFGGHGALAQAIVDLGNDTVSYPAPAWMEMLLPDPNDPQVQAYAKQQQQLRATRLKLEQVRRAYFDIHTDTEHHQLGLLVLREKYNQPQWYPLLLEVFAKEKDDVRTGILDMLVDTATEEADAAIAWESVFDRSDTMRSAAADRLAQRMESRQAQKEAVPEKVKFVVAAGLQNENNSEVLAAAGVAEMLNLYEMIPLLIAAQVGGDTRNAASERTGNLGWIMIAQQQAFVSDLTPVVGNSAVAFDPTLSVVTEGVVLEVKNAVVLTYRTEVFYTLTRMASRAMGVSPARFGRMKIDEAKWRDWYTSEWQPWYEKNKDRIEQPYEEG